ncbi:glycine/sarcosine/betaine reductase selenoprotein B family protein [Falsiroseomonas selenitidurans]|uniref:Uncharacterized protein n=1 Tax=Falsiroseomonas selenitidurans TaxID=2716335 RepID=A0ABX1E1T8_9PROT|nr:glycine/sarcosine/betaine reductase selenoprotein B family protein [Falsiroseomonas selenitidurans]NKC31124.1 hypothetical protein [Falsiroseomonas selenitidurans]
MVAIRDMPSDVREALLARAADMPIWANTACVAGPGLAQRRIALVTTAGLHLRGEPHFRSGTGEFRVIPGDVDPGALIMSQTSTTYDRTGFQEDVNTVFPLDRLREMQAEGVVGSLAARHFAFIGSATEAHQIKPHAEEVARALRADGVTGVLILPVCPSCTRGAAILGHVIEAGGVPTVGISLVREHTAVIRPPRALHVPFELGRPLGVPGDAAFQRRVIERLLGMLRRVDGPILETYEEVPAFLGEDRMAGWTCPVPLPAPPAGSALGDAVRQEMRLLAPWRDEAVRRRGRTTTGLSTLPAEAIAELLIAFHTDPANTAPPAGQALAAALRYGVDDLKTWYHEAALARPGPVPGLRMADWVYGETAFGRLLLELHAACAAHADPAVVQFGAVRLVPTHQRHRLG